MDITAVYQDSAGWLIERQGCLSASRMKDALAFSKKDPTVPLKGRADYMQDLVAERLAGCSVDHMVTRDMQRGIEQEPHAVVYYKQLRGYDIQPAAWVNHPTIDLFGATPDGWVGSDGLIEVKCPRINNLVRWAVQPGIPEEHLLQLITQQLVTGRKWTDFCAYNADMPVGKKMLIRRFEATDEQLRMVEDGSKQFLAEAEEMFTRISELDFS